MSDRVSLPTPIYARSGAVARDRGASRSGASTLYWIVAGWTVASSLYYIDSVWTGHINLEPDEGLYHKAFKYAVTLALSLYVAIRYRMSALLLIPACLAIQAAIVYFAYPQSRPIVDVYVVLICMSGLTGLLAVLGPQGNERLPYVIVGTGAIVGVISGIEIFMLNALFEDHWRNTGGMRSISSLFNPNNLGLYLGVCTIFLLALDLKPYKKLLTGIPIGFGLAFSGSRTAWLALLTVVLVSMLYSLATKGHMGRALVRPGFLLQAVLSLSGVVAVLLAFDSKALDFLFELELRGLDTDTADVRKENLLTYASGFGWQTLLPDVYARNTVLTTDSAYLILLNSFGLVLLAVYAVLAMLFYKGALRVARPFSRQWRYVLLFYLIAALADSTTNAFPNNQMFFISLGAVLSYRLRRVAAE